MILSFTDLHLGLKDNSKQEADGLYTSEVEAYKALDYIYNYCAKKENNIELVIFKGDWFHHTTPASIHYTKTIKFFHSFNKLDIPFYAIPGNHEATVFSNCLSLIHELNLKNIKLFDQLDKINAIQYKHYNIYFIPYVYSESMKDRDINVEQNMVDVINTITTNNNIIVSHIHEISAKIGAESLMIAKGVDLIDIDHIANKVKLILLGHIHKQQIYEKKGISIVYTGSTYPQNKKDVDQGKGFSLIDDNLNISFHNIPTLRKYHKVIINEETYPNLDNILSSRKFKQKDVVYFDIINFNKDIIIQDNLYKLCEKYKLVIGDISFSLSANDFNNYAEGIIEEESPYDTFKKWANNIKNDDISEEFINNSIITANVYIDLFYKVG